MYRGTWSFPVSWVTGSSSAMLGVIIIAEHSTAKLEGFKFAHDTGIPWEGSREL